MWWITGGSGLLGKQIQHHFKNNHIPYIATDTDIDICDPSAMEMFYTKYTPKGIINCAAFTQVDRCETLDIMSNELAVNCLGPKNLAALSHKHNIPLIHFSTDYVFDGHKTMPYTELDTPNPLTRYGLSKLKGDAAVMCLAEKHYVIRISWLYGEYGTNFVDKIKTMMLNGVTEINVVNDQIGSLTNARDLAGFVASLMETKEYGVYNFSGQNPCSWYDVVTAIGSILNATQQTQIIPISTQDASIRFKLLAQRPAYSYLSKDKITNVFGYKSKTWMESLTEYLKG